MKILCRFPFFSASIALILLLVPASARFPRGSGAVAPLSTGDVLMGLGGVAYYTNGPPFLNWAISGGGQNAYDINLTAGGTLDNSTAYSTGVIDSNGELIAGSGLSAIASISKGLFTPAPDTQALVPPNNGASPWWSGLQMKVTYTGTSAPALSGSLGTGGVALSCASNVCTFTFGLNPLNVGLNFPVSNVNDPPKNIFVYEVQYQSQVTALATCTPNVNCNHFRPAYTATINVLGRLRSMDWMDVNGSGEFDTSAMADFNYQICLACRYGGLGVQSASISGTTLTVSAGSQFANLGPNVTVNGSGVTAGTIITAGVCSPGSGCGGTYTVNNSQSVGSETMYFSATTGYSGPSGPKGGVHPSVMIELARLTSSDIYFNLPINITNAGMTNVATYFRDNMPAGMRVFFEIGNENWNFGLGLTYFWLNAAGTPLFGSAGGVSYGGYRMSQLMAIAAGVFGTNGYNATLGRTTSRWGAVVGGQMTNDVVTPTAFIAGFTAWQSAFSPSTVPSDLYSEVVVAPYFSDFPSSTQVSSVTPGATTTVCTNGGGFIAGQVVRLFFNTTTGGTVGSVLNGQYVTVASPSGSCLSFSSISTAGLTYTTGSANDYVATDNNGANLTSSSTVKPLYDTAEASAACATSSAAAIGSGSITGNTLTSGSVTGGPIKIGQGLSGQSGIPANTYINSGSGSSWTLNNSVTGTVTGSMATAPCTTPYQYFAQQTSKALITGSPGDLGYVPSIAQNIFPAILATNKLYANTLNLTLSNYEGGSQFQITGEMGAIGAVDNLDGMFLNWKWDAAGNDPLYTPAKVYQNQFAMMRGLYLPYSAQYVEQSSGATFSGVRFLGDSNPSFSAILAENAAGLPVDPTPAPTWAVNYNASTDHNFNSGSPTSMTCPLSVPVSGLAIIVATWANATAAISQVQIDSGTPITVPDAQTINAWSQSIYSQAVSAGSHTATITWGSGATFASCYALSASGLTSNTVRSAITGNPQRVAPLNVTKGSLIIAAGGLTGTETFAASSSGSGTVTGNVTQIDNNGAQASGIAYWSPGPSFSSSIFSISTASANGITAASYR